MRKLFPLLLLGVLVAAAFAVGGAMRGEIGVDFTPEGIRGFVEALGWKAPLIFVALVTFRNFLLLPSAVILTVGGLCFGGLVGTALGAAGIVGSALMKFSLSRWLGREWVRTHLGASAERLERRIANTGPLLVGLMTAHPMGAMSPFHWGAGLSSVTATAFTLAVVLGGPVRAGAYAALGSAFFEFEWTSPRFWLTAALFVGLVLLPLAHPGLRRRLLGSWRRGSGPP